MNTKRQELAGDITLMDHAVVHYHALGWDFVDLLDAFINPPLGSKRYVFSGPRYLILVEELDLENPEDPESDKIDPYWHIAYQNCLDGLETLFKIAPYKLDKVCFMRNKIGNITGFRFYKWDKLQKILSNGITKKTSSSSSTTSTASSASTNG